MLLSHMHIMEDTTAKSMLRTAAAVDELTLTAHRARSNNPVADDDAEQAPVDDLSDEDVQRRQRIGGKDDWQRRAELTRHVWGAFSYHCPIATALGARASSLVHKCSSHLHSLGLETWSMEDLEGMLAGAVAYCSDFGTEVGLAEVPRAKMWEWFDSNVMPKSLGPDTGEEDCLEEDEGPTHLYERMLPILGWLHIADNCTAQMHEQMKWFPNFLIMLNLICSLLCDTAHLETFRASLKMRGMHHLLVLFDRSSLSYQEWRWSSMIIVLLWILPLRKALAEVWCEEAFAHAPKKTRSMGSRVVSSPLNVKGITNAIGLALFWACGGMCLALQVASSLQQVSGCTWATLFEILAFFLTREDDGRVCEDVDF